MKMTKKRIKSKEVFGKSDPYSKGKKRVNAASAFCLESRKPVASRKKKKIFDVFGKRETSGLLGSRLKPLEVGEIVRNSVARLGKNKAQKANDASSCLME